MGNEYELQYIMDGTGNYYRINAQNQLVVAGGKDDASVFSAVEVNERIGDGKKSNFYKAVPVGGELGATASDNIISIKDVIGEEAYDIEIIDWLDYVNLFAYISKMIPDYKETLQQSESEVDRQISDLMHLVELYDLSEEETIRTMNMLKDARIRRRVIKNRKEQIDIFQRNLGTSANIAKAKSAIADLKKQENKKYTPREYKDIFKGMNDRETDRLTWRYEDTITEPEEEMQEMEVIQMMEPQREEKQMEERPMDICKRETIFDNVKNDWAAVAKQQYEFFTNIQQYLMNLDIELDEVEQKIEDSLQEMEEANYSAAQGYKAFKDLQDLRRQRKEMLKEYEQLRLMVGCFDCDAMADAYGYVLENFSADNL